MISTETHIFYWFCIVGLLALSVMVEVRNNLDAHADMEKFKTDIVDSCLEKNRMDIALNDDDILYFFDCAQYGHGTMRPIPK